MENKESVKDIIAEANELLKSCQNFRAEMDKMNEGIAFLQNEYKINKRYFREEPGRCTIDDVIKTVFEFAWQDSKQYNCDN